MTWPGDKWVEEAEGGNNLQLRRPPSPVEGGSVASWFQAPLTRHHWLRHRLTNNPFLGCPRHRGRALDTLNVNEVMVGHPSPLTRGEAGQGAENSPCTRGGGHPTVVSIIPTLQINKLRLRENNQLELTIALKMLLNCIQSFSDSLKPDNSMTASSSFFSFEYSIPTACNILLHSFTAQKISDSAQMSPPSQTLRDALRPNGSLPPLGTRTFLYLRQSPKDKFPKLQSIIHVPFPHSPLSPKLVFASHFNNLVPFLLN